MLFSPVTRTSRSADLGFEMRGFARRPTGGTGSPDRPCRYFLRNPGVGSANSGDRKTVPNPAKSCHRGRLQGPG